MLFGFLGGFDFAVVLIECFGCGCCAFGFMISICLFIWFYVCESFALVDLFDGAMLIVLIFIAWFAFMLFDFVWFIVMFSY